MIKVGPNITIPVGGSKKGVFNVVTDLPGLVTLTASDPGVILTPSSFTVGGSVDSWVNSAGINMGIAASHAASWTMAYRRNFAVGLELFFPTGHKAGATNLFLYNGDVNSTNTNWCLMINMATRKLGWYWVNGSGSGVFAYTFPADVRSRCVFVANVANCTLYTSAGSQTVAYAVPIGTDAKYGSAGNCLCRQNGQYQPSILYDFVFCGGIPSGDNVTGDIGAYVAGGDLGSTKLCNLKMDEESGLIVYDHTVNMYDWGADHYDATAIYAQSLICGLTRTITGLTGNEQSITYDTGSVAPGTAVTITATRVKAGFPTGRTPDISKETDTMTITLTAFDTTVLTTWRDVLEKIIENIESIIPSTYESKNFQYGELDWEDTMQKQPNLFRTFELKINDDRIPKFHGNKTHEIGTISIEIKVWYKRNKGNSRRGGVFDDAIAMDDSMQISRALYDPLQFVDGTRCRIIKRDSLTPQKEGYYTTLTIPFDLEYYWVKVPT